MGLCQRFVVDFFITGWDVFLDDINANGYSVN